jgi:hypothetical protein
MRLAHKRGLEGTDGYPFELAVAAADSSRHSGDCSNALAPWGVRAPGKRGWREHGLVLLWFLCMLATAPGSGAAVRTHVTAG